MQKLDKKQVLLQVRNVYAGYEDSDILKDINLHVNYGEIVSVIGLNGAGKSTIFKVIYGFIKERSGKVWFNGQNVTGYRPQDMLRAGVTIVPQISSVFPQMSVYENLEFGMYLVRDKAKVRQRIGEIFDLFPFLAERSKQQAGRLSGGERRSLEISRALMSQPKLLMMDEPSAGLAPAISHVIFQILMRMNRELGLAILIIEQNTRQVLQISHRGYVLELGQNNIEGSGQDLLSDLRIRQTFLGQI